MKRLIISTLTRKVGEKIVIYKLLKTKKMEWYDQFDDLLEKLQIGWVQAIQAIQTGNFEMLLTNPVMIMTVAGLLQLTVLVILIKMKLIGPILKFIIFVLVLGIFRLMIMAMKASSH